MLTISPANSMHFPFNCRHFDSGLHQRAFLWVESSPQVYKADLLAFKGHFIHLSSLSLCLCVCAHFWRSTCILAETRNDQPVSSSRVLHFVFCRQSLLQDWNLLIRLGWLVSKLQRFTYCCFPCAGITSHHVYFFIGFIEGNQCSHDCESSLDWLSCLPRLLSFCDNQWLSISYC